MKNKDIQKYLFNLDNSLNIKQWIMELDNDNKKKYQPIGRIILNKAQIALKQIISNLESAYLLSAQEMRSTLPYQGYHRSSLYQRQVANTRYNPMSSCNHNVNAYTLILLLY